MVWFHKIPILIFDKHALRLKIYVLSSSSVTNLSIDSDGKYELVYNLKDIR